MVGTDIALAVVSLAVEKATQPMMHTLIYYVQHKGLDIGYHFNMLFCPKEAMGEWFKDYDGETVEHPYSAELSEDLANSISADILNSKRGSAIFILPGPIIINNRGLYIDRFNAQSNIKFQELQSMIKDALKNPIGLLDECHKWYLDEI